MLINCYGKQGTFLKMHKIKNFPVKGDDANFQHDCESVPKITSGLSPFMEISTKSVHEYFDNFASSDVSLTQKYRLFYGSDNPDPLLTSQNLLNQRVQDARIGYLCIMHH